MFLCREMDTHVYAYLHAAWWSGCVRQVSYHNRHAEPVCKARSLDTNLLFSFSKFYRVFMTSHAGGVTLSMVHGGPEMVVHAESVGEGYTPSCELVRTPGSPGAEYDGMSKASRAVNALESTARRERVPSRDTLTRPSRTWGTREAGVRTIEEEYE